MTITHAKGWYLEIDSISDGVRRFESQDEPELVDISGRSFIKVVNNDVWTHIAVDDDVKEFRVGFVIDQLKVNCDG